MYESTGESGNPAESSSPRTRKNGGDATTKVDSTSCQFEDDVSAAAKAAEDYRAKMFEYMKVNVNTVLDYANNLASVKSPIEIIAPSTARPRKPVENECPPSLEKNVADAAQIAEDYRVLLFEIMKNNLGATLDYAQRLANVKSSPEFIDVSARHARKQFETIAAQTAALGALAQKLALRNIERIAVGFTSVFTPHKNQIGGEKQAK